ncbi:LytR/AlgR family response regulator transcription factor [Algoriphagus vanfongensis]|uniref:LytR/AlgR family response regulator transcription factor n=1 Tax=Algoriphagus vanfongensis TaxID=426371 RepID=UPI00040B4659|nr:response regulator [Algoriphagus vanfongensis]
METQPLLKIGLIDDEQHQLDYLTDQISRNEGYEVAYASTQPLEALQWILNNPLDILILDLIMPKLGGLELAKRIQGLQIPIIICSAHGDLALEGYKIKALSFLEKPSSPTDLTDALEYAREMSVKFNRNKRMSQESIIVIGNNKTFEKVVIQASEVCVLEQNAKFTKIHLIGGEMVEAKQTLDTTLEQMNSMTMLRVHKSYAVNAIYLHKVKAYECEMKNGITARISRSYKKDFFKQIENGFSI